MKEMSQVIILSLIANYIRHPKSASRVEDAIGKLKNKFEIYSNDINGSSLKIFAQVEFDCGDMTGRRVPTFRMNRKTHALSIYIVLAQESISRLSSVECERFVLLKIADSLRLASSKYDELNDDIAYGIKIIEGVREG